MGAQDVRKNDCNDCVNCGNPKVDQKISVGPTGARFYTMRCLFCGNETEPTMLQNEVIGLWNEMNPCMIGDDSYDALIMRLEEINDDIEEHERGIEYLVEERQDVQAKLRRAGVLVVSD